MHNNHFIEYDPTIILQITQIAELVSEFAFHTLISNYAMNLPYVVFLNPSAIAMLRICSSLISFD